MPDTPLQPHPVDAGQQGTVDAGQPEDQPTGQVLDARYRLGRVLGVGGAATVYEAFDEALGVRRAVKVLAPHGPHVQILGLRLRAEAKAMAALSHPNVLRVFDIGQDEEDQFIVMELAEFGTVAEWLERLGALPPLAAVGFMIQVLSALGAAHAAGVVHRDVKPQNILVGGQGNALLADFGIARMDVAGTSRNTRTNVAMGSLCFMAPEQRIDARSVGVGADIYAAGCTLYNLLTDENPMDLFAAEPHSSRWELVPESIRGPLQRATRYSPEERYLDAAGMAKALLAALEPLGGLNGLPATGGESVGGGLPMPSAVAVHTAVSMLEHDAGHEGVIPKLSADPTWQATIQATGRAVDPGEDGDRLQRGLVLVLVVVSLIAAAALMFESGLIGGSAPLVAPAAPQAPQPSLQAPERPGPVEPTAPEVQEGSASAPDPTPPELATEGSPAAEPTAPVQTPPEVRAPAPEAAEQQALPFGRHQGGFNGRGAVYQLRGTPDRVMGSIITLGPDNSEAEHPVTGRYDAGTGALYLEDIDQGSRDAGVYNFQLRPDGKGFNGLFTPSTGEGALRVFIFDKVAP